MGQGECVVPGVRVVAPHVGQSPLLYAAVVQIASLESLSRQLVFHTLWICVRKARSLCYKFFIIIRECYT